MSRLFTFEYNNKKPMIMRKNIDTARRRRRPAGAHTQDCAIERVLQQLFFSLSPACKSPARLLCLRENLISIVRQLSRARDLHKALDDAIACNTQCTTKLEACGEHGANLMRNSSALRNRPLPSRAGGAFVFVCGGGKSIDSEREKNNIAHFSSRFFFFCNFSPGSRQLEAR